MTVRTERQDYFRCAILTAGSPAANLRAMGNVLPFKPPKKSSNKERARGRTMCDSGFHKWAVDKRKQFDVKRGKLVTVHRCQRCGETKVTAD